MAGLLVPGCIRQTLGIKVCQRCNASCDAIDFFSVHEEYGAQLLGNLNPDAPEVTSCTRIAPQTANLPFLESATWPLDAHHDPFFVSTRPNRSVWECVSEGAKNCLCFAHL